MSGETAHAGEQERVAIGNDSRGYFCLRCEWPGLEFTYNRSRAIAHKTVHE